mmetsp:Transcript_20831/g.44753  ORF Transcript_20831/g.44753 Transcript_20831/m.44753 type:complete len:254 (-) Transcript_20831:94-855(-)
MPTTINSGVALVKAAKGNVALALLLTVASNLLGIFTVPFTLALLLVVDDVAIDPFPLLLKLISMILLPLVLGKLARESSARVLAFYSRHKLALSLLSSVVMSVIVWMSISSSASVLKQLAWQNVIGLLIVGILIHVIYLTFNYAAASFVLGLTTPTRKAVVIMASQKTLPMAITVLNLFPPSLGEPGLIAAPCITSHLVQTLIDAFIAGKWSMLQEEYAPVPIWRRFACCSRPPIATDRVVQGTKLKLSGGVI